MEKACRARARTFALGIGTPVHVELVETPVVVVATELVRVHLFFFGTLKVYKYNSSQWYCTLWLLDSIRAILEC